MDLFSSNRHKLIAAQAVVVAGLCVGLYFLLLKPESSSRLTGAGVPGRPHAQSGHPRRRQSRPSGRRHGTRRGAGRRAPGRRAHGVTSPGTGALQASATPPPAAAALDGSGPGSVSGPATRPSEATTPDGPGTTQYESTVATLHAKLAGGAPPP